MNRRERSVLAGTQSGLRTSQDTDGYPPRDPHRLKTVVDSVFEFADAQKAYEKLLSRQFFGKIVVKI